MASGRPDTRWARHQSVDADDDGSKRRELRNEKSRVWRPYEPAGVIAMSEDGEDHPVSSLPEELSDLWNAIRPLFRRLPNARKAIDWLTGGLASAGTKALASRLDLYRTGNLVKEARQVADASGLPLPAVFDKLIRQRRIDELTMDALRRVGESADSQDATVTNAAEGDSKDTAHRWFHTFYEVAGTVDEADVREAFVRILAGEIQTPRSFSVRTLRAVGAMSLSTAQHFRRAASVSIRLTPDGKHIIDARIPAIGGSLGSNCLQEDGLPYSVLTDLTENGLLHTDYGSYQPYGPLDLPADARQSLVPVQIPFAHQDAKWVLIPKDDIKKATSLKVTGAQLTSCGVELLKIADIEPLPKFTSKLVAHFSQSGYQMVPSG